VDVTEAVASAIKFTYTKSKSRHYTIVLRFTKNLNNYIKFEPLFRKFFHVFVEKNFEKYHG
jgi:hypothetical protein